ncbi:retrotransposon Gag-like protein 5 [Schistocerca gregaria]|uniref:retrotransposon Gag-like protein 5 n=1 Tax=Schistocerca gregaria TaxID=7010 RepID=UPI00211E7C0A|nr:retrotransposon Gag-like protein 5 [Schistocerca gregaria]
MSQVRAMATGTSTTMLRARRKDINVKPNRRLDRRSSRGMIFENEELRLRTISINAEVEKGQNDIKKLRRENEQLRREIWGLRDEYDRLEQLLAKLQHHQQNSGSEEENEEEGELEQEQEQEHESDGNGTVAENARNQQKMSRELSGETEDGGEEGEPAERIAAELVAAHRVHELCARVGGPRCCLTKGRGYQPVHKSSKILCTIL